MARKNLIYSFPLINAEITADTTSPSTNVSQLDQASIDLRWAGSTLVATAQVQVKNGENAEWRVLDFGSPITISGANGAHEIILLTMPFTDLRMFLDVSSGTGSVTAIITAKSVGA